MIRLLVKRVGRDGEWGWPLAHVVGVADREPEADEVVLVVEGEAPEWLEGVGGTEERAAVNASVEAALWVLGAGDAVD